MSEAGGSGKDLPKPQAVTPVGQPGKRSIEMRFEERSQLTVQLPFLPPGVLSEYKKIGIEPQRLLDMVERRAQQRENIEHGVLRMEEADRIEKSRATRRGQTLGAWCIGGSLLTLVIGFFVAPQQASEVAKLMGSLGVLTIAAAFVGARWINKKRVNEEHENELAKLRARLERIEQARLPE